MKIFSFHSQFSTPHEAEYNPCKWLISFIHHRHEQCAQQYTAREGVSDVESVWDRRVHLHCYNVV